MSNAGTAVCTHHWVLATPDDDIVRGRCKRCGETREYPASLEGASREGITAEAAGLRQQGTRFGGGGGGIRAN